MLKFIQAKFQVIYILLTQTHNQWALWNLPYKWSCDYERLYFTYFYWQYRAASGSSRKNRTNSQSFFEYKMQALSISCKDENKCRDTGLRFGLDMRFS